MKVYRKNIVYDVTKILVIGLLLLALCGLCFTSCLPSQAEKPKTETSGNEVRAETLDDGAIKITNPDGSYAIEKTEKGETGNTIKIKREYDKDGKLRTKIETEYNADGKIVLKIEYRVEYDEYGKVKRKVWIETTYDENGKVKKEVIEEWEYNELGKASSGNVTRIEYHENGTVKRKESGEFDLGKKLPEELVSKLINDCNAEEIEKTYREYENNLIGKEPKNEESCEKVKNEIKDIYLICLIKELIKIECMGKCNIQEFTEFISQLKKIDERFEKEYPNLSSQAYFEASELIYKKIDECLNKILEDCDCDIEALNSLRGIIVRPPGGKFHLWALLSQFHQRELVDVKILGKIFECRNKIEEQDEEDETGIESDTDNESESKITEEELIETLKEIIEEFKKWAEEQESQTDNKSESNMTEEALKRLEELLGDGSDTDNKSELPLPKSD